MKSISLAQWFHLVIKHLGRGGHITIRVLGDSMCPTYLKGESVVVRGCDHERIKRGDVIVFRHWDNATIHRVMEVKRNEAGIYFQTKGDNNPCPDNYTVTGDEVIGIVVGKG